MNVRTLFGTVKPEPPQRKNQETCIVLLIHWVLHSYYCIQSRMWNKSLEGPIPSGRGWNDTSPLSIRLNIVARKHHPLSSRTQRKQVSLSIGRINQPRDTGSDGVLSFINRKAPLLVFCWSSWIQLFELPIRFRPATMVCPVSPNLLQEVPDDLNFNTHFSEDAGDQGSVATGSNSATIDILVLL